MIDFIFDDFGFVECEMEIRSLKWVKLLGFILHITSDVYGLIIVRRRGGEKMDKYDETRVFYC